MTVRREDRRLSGVVVAVVLLVAPAVAACSSGAEAPAVPAAADNAAQLDIGREIWGSRCASCHGASGGGGRAPRLNGGRVLERFPDPADQLAVIAEGRGGMPAYGNALDEAELDALVAYTREVIADS